VQEHQLRSGHFVAVLILTIIDIMFHFWPSEWSNLMPESGRIAIQYVGTAAIVGIILWWIWPKLKSVFQKKSATQIPQAQARVTQVAIQRIPKELLSILGQEPSDRPSVLMNSISTICALIIITYASLLLNLWRIGKLTIHIDLYLFLFIGIFIVFPILILLDTWVWERKYYQLGKSAVEKHKTFTLCGNRDEVFSGCLNILKERIRLRQDSRILEMKRPKFIKALIGGSRITTQIKQVKKGVAEIYFQSDSKWLTTKFDWGSNQKNVDKFECLILEEISNKER
jgi:hypothetical protein